MSNGNSVNFSCLLSPRGYDGSLLGGSVAFGSSDVKANTRAAEKASPWWLNSLNGVTYFVSFQFLLLLNGGKEKVHFQARR